MESNSDISFLDLASVNSNNNNGAAMAAANSGNTSPTAGAGGGNRYTKPYSCPIPTCTSSFWKPDTRIEHLTTHLLGARRPRSTSRDQYSLDEVLRYVKKGTEEGKDNKDGGIEVVERRLTEWWEDKEWIIVEGSESEDTEREASHR
ncbi:hypothetical protein K402DRAFT_395680 [Aulographum hederae CBS 113979]|uniref:C2H2-type domain-containing protein n=1 Tax=Aulographum hederae CBS 113979 TaxID=1176131 RepID=A0A6G1GTP1_9PEZI|nr:hypothetical protein K402DRAFT_395680 [Aulographum hederae CBS 113979]